MFSQPDSEDYPHGVTVTYDSGMRIPVVPPFDPEQVQSHGLYL